MRLNIPNSLTLLRIVLIPVFVLLFYLDFAGARQLAAVIFILAAITDWFDGYLARQLQQMSQFGAFLDPVADKLMVAVALVVLVAADADNWLITVTAAVIIGREITVSALREWMAELGSRTTVAVSLIGKFKTAAQMTAISLMLWHQPLLGLPIYQIGTLLLYLAAVLTLWSMLVYLRAAWPLLRD